MRTAWRTIIGASVAAVVCVTSAATATAGVAPSGPQVQVWLTTVDGSQRLAPQAPVSFTGTASTAPTIVLDPRTTYQTMDGFGAAITDSSAAVLSALPKDTRDATMASLFDPKKGIGISMLRQPIGASDFTAAAQDYTFDDMPAGQTDFPMAHFSIAHDEAQVLPLLRQAKRLNPRLEIVATPWSAPAWMKDSGALDGGRLKPGYAYAAAYAAYLTKFVVAYRKAGVPIDYLTIQNEPQNRMPNGYPGMDMPVEDEARVISILGPTLAAVSPQTKILGYDHNWQEHPNDVANTPAGRSPETDYPYELLQTSAAKWVAGTAYHCYYGDPRAQTALHDAFPDKGIWFTECSGSHGANDAPADIFSGTLKWHARTLTVGVTRNWAKSVLTWNIALDENGGPHLGGCDTCTGLVTTHPDGSVSTNAEFYTIGHLSKFVKPGAVRIGSTSFGTTGWNGQVTDVAFRNPDGTIALIAHNENDDPRTVAVALGSRTFEYTLPGGSLATFTFRPTGALDDGLRAVDLTGATAAATNNASTAGLTVDADASTRWSSGAAQAPGMGVTVDLGAAKTFRRVAIDAGGNLGDYPRAYRVEASSDGTAWTTLAQGAGAAQLIDVDVPRTTARYVRISSTGSSGNWWSIADLRLYN